MEASAFERLDEGVHDPECALETPRTDAEIETLLPPGADGPVETRPGRSEHFRREAHQGMGIDELPRDPNAVPRLTFEGFLGRDLVGPLAGAALTRRWGDRGRAADPWAKLGQRRRRPPAGLDPASLAKVCRKLEIPVPPRDTVPKKRNIA